MTIVHIGPPHLPILYSLGGAIERRIRELSVRQAKAGARVVVYSAEDQTQSTDYKGVEVRAIQCRRRGTLRAAEFLLKTLRNARTLKPQVIHFHSLAEGAMFTRTFARELRARTLLSYDYFVFRRGKKNPLFPWYRRALKGFSSLLPVSGYCQRQSASYWSIPEERMQILYNGVSVQQFAPDSAAAAARRAALGLKGEFVVLYVGRVCQQKGTDLLIDACARLRNEGRNLRLVVAGPIGQFGYRGADELTQCIEHNHGLYLGPVEEDALPSVYNMADVFVMPTRTNEMFGMAAVEAQACGRTVICSDNGGLPEVIGSSGLLFRSGDSQDLAQKLRSCMDDPGLRQRFSQAAVINAKRFAWETITAQLERVYQQVAP